MIRERKTVHTIPWQFDLYYNPNTCSIFHEISIIFVFAYFKIQYDKHMLKTIIFKTLKSDLQGGKTVGTTIKYSQK